jgi:hypothetical protein
MVQLKKKSKQGIQEEKVNFSPILLNHSSDLVVNREKQSSA